MEPVGFGVVGAGSAIANQAILPALAASDQCNLVAAASLRGEVDPKWAAVAVDSYEAVLTHPAVEVVYIPLPNHLHLEWIERCAAAGKHVLCEKPLALTASDAHRAAEVCRAAGVMCAEAWMTPFHKRWQFMMLHATSGDLGPVNTVHSSFHFEMAIGDGSNHRLNPTMGGGALYDLGIYCLGPAVKLWGAEPDTVEIIELNVIDSTDRSLAFNLGWNDGRRAYGSCSFEKEDQQSIEIVCAEGSIEVSDAAHTGGGANPSFTWHRESVIDGDGGWGDDAESDTHTVEIPSNDPYQTMLERFALAVRDERQWPRPMEEVVAMTGLIDRIRAHI